MHSCFRNESYQDSFTHQIHSSLNLWFGCRNATFKSFSEFGAQSDIVKVNIGLKHCALLTKDGHLYTYGNNQYGQLGVGHHDDQFTHPVPVDSLRGKLMCIFKFLCYETKQKVICYKYIWRNITVWDLIVFRNCYKMLYLSLFNIFFGVVDLRHVCNMAYEIQIAFYKTRK